MKRWLVSVALLGLVACSEQGRTALPGGVSNPGAVAVAGGRVFVTTPQSNSLRVLDLGLDGGTREFVRAPNPMFPLQVPTVRQPLHVVTVSAAPGARVLAVSSAYDNQIRLVDGEALTALGRPVVLPGPVVQMVLHPDGGRLVALTDAPAGEALPGAVVEITLDPAVLADPAAVGSDAEVATEVRTVAVDAVPGGLALTAAAGSLEAWVSDARAAELVRVDLGTGAQSRLPSGRSLGRLAASPAFEDVDGARPAGAYVFGVSRESPELLAFDVAEGAIHEDLILEGELLPIPLPAIGTAVLAVADGVAPATTDLGRQARAVRVPLLLLVPALDGSVVYVSGSAMRTLDTDGDLDVEPSVSVSPAVSGRDEEGSFDGSRNESAPVLTTRPAASGDAPLEALVLTTPGVTRSRTWQVAWQGVVPRQEDVLGRLVGEEAPGSLAPVFPPRDLTDRVQPGDRVEVEGPTVDSEVLPDCEVYEGEDGVGWRVASVTSDSLVLEAEPEGAPLPTTDCFPEDFRYTVRAQGFTVVAEDLPEVWRLLPGETFRYEGQRFLKTSPLVVGPELRFTLVETQPTDTWEPGVTRTLEVDGGADPRVMKVDGSMRDPRDPLGRSILGPGHLPGFLDVAGPEDGLSELRAFVPYAHGDLAPGFVISFPLDAPTTQRVEY